MHQGAFSFGPKLQDRQKQDILFSSVAVMLRDVVHGTTHVEGLRVEAGTAVEHEVVQNSQRGGASLPLNYGLYSTR